MIASCESEAILPAPRLHRLAIHLVCRRFAHHLISDVVRNGKPCADILPYCERLEELRRAQNLFRSRND